MLDWLKRAGSGPTSNAGIWHLYRERYEAQQTGAQVTKLPPLSRLLPILRRLWRRLERDRRAREATRRVRRQAAKGHGYVRLRPIERGVFEGWRGPASPC